MASSDDEPEALDVVRHIRAFYAQYPRNPRSETAQLDHMVLHQTLSQELTGRTRLVEQDKLGEYLSVKMETAPKSARVGGMYFALKVIRKSEVVRLKQVLHLATAAHTHACGRTQVCSCYLWPCTTCAWHPDRRVALTLLETKATPLPMIGAAGAARARAALGDSALVRHLTVFILSGIGSLPRT